MIKFTLIPITPYLIVFQGTEGKDDVVQNVLIEALLVLDRAATQS